MISKVKSNDTDNRLSIDSDYTVILRRAVAEIEHVGLDEKVQRCVALLPWFHNMLLLSKGLDDDAMPTETVKGGTCSQRHGEAYRRGGLPVD